MTTTTECPSCGAAQTQTQLCQPCTDALATLLAAAPTLLEQLDVAAAKQARLTPTGPTGKGTAHTRTPIDWTALEARDALLNELAIWGTNARHIRRDPHAAHALAGLARATRQAFTAIDRRPDLRYLGQCHQVTGDVTCTAELWAAPDAHTHTCPACSTRHHVADRQTRLLHAAEDHLDTATNIANALATLDQPVTAERIRKWKQRGRIAERPEGSKLYRLGDVIQLLDHHRKATA